MNMMFQDSSVKEEQQLIISILRKAGIEKRE
jgi:hypothetical protein